MKKKLDIVLSLAAAAVLLLLLAAILYKQASGAPVIGTIRGAEWEHLTVEETEYAFDPAPPVHGADKGAFLGIATSGDLRFRIYSIKNSDDYLYCQWEWEGRIYRRIH